MRKITRFSKSVVGTLACLYFGGLGMIGWGLLPTLLPGIAPSGMTIDGRSMSTSEANEAVNEIGKIVKNVNAGDLNSLNTDLELKTPMARKFRDYLVQRKSIEAEYQAALSKCPFPPMFQGDRLQTIEGRSKSLHQIDLLEVACRQHTVETNRQTQEFGEFMAKLSHKFQRSTMDSSISTSNELLEKELALYEGYRRIIDYINKQNPPVGHGKMELSKTEIGVFERMGKELEDAESDFLASKAIAVKESQKSIDDNLGAVVSGTLP